MNFTAILIEDEVPARETLKSYLSRYFENIKVIAEIDTVEESLSYLKNHNADILFLDVQLKDGKGIDILDKIESGKYKLVFTTAFDGYALEAFKHRSFGYLLKPLDPDDFKEIVGRVIRDLSFGDEKISKKIKLPVASGYRWIELKNIVRCESDSNYTKIFVKDHASSFLLTKTLKVVENEIINSNRFIRVHQSHLINIDYISDKKIQNNVIVMSNGDKIPVSRANKNLFF